MKVTEYTRQHLKRARERRRMVADGYQMRTILKYQLRSEMHLVIVAAQPAADGKSVWIKTEYRP